MGLGGVCANDDRNSRQFSVDSHRLSYVAHVTEEWQVAKTVKRSSESCLRELEYVVENGREFSPLRRGKWVVGWWQDGLCESQMVVKRELPI